jgi:hypothetical protein
MKKKVLLTATLGMCILFTSLSVGSNPLTTKGIDDDGDGVINTEDFCPWTPWGAIVDEQGCPIQDAEYNYDTDGDGVVDGVDQCISVPGTIPTGCP